MIAPKGDRIEKFLDEVEKENTTIYDRVKAIRRVFDLTQTEFGSKVNLSKTTIAQIESDVRNVTDRTINDISRVFGVEEQWLKTGEGNIFKPIVDEGYKQKYDDVMHGDNVLHKNLLKAVLDMDNTQIAVFGMFLDKLKSTD